MKNTIKNLKDEGGGVVAGERLINFIANRYQNLFLSNVGGQAEEILNFVQPCASQDMNDYLLSPFTGEDVWAALESIGDLKAPGADGMPSIFYKKFWPIVGDYVKSEVLNVLNGGVMPQGWNDTVIVLIPKVKNPEKIGDLRPISLCNVLYKLISKALANRL